MSLVCLSYGRLLAHPSLGGLEKSFLTRILSVGKESWSAREGETSDMILVGKDRDRGRISRDVTRRCIVAGSET